MKKKIGNYQLSKTIGKGTFGLVKQGIHLPTSQKVAIKILQKSKIVDDKDMKNIIQQLSILKRVNHLNIVKLYQLIQTDKKIYIITQYIDGGQLYQNIINQGRLEESKAKRYFYQIVQGIKYLHKNRIVHRDLKPQNIIVDKNQTIKIIDFGLGREYEENERLRTSCGSPCYAAPEMISGDKYVPLCSDIWSVGIILYAMVCGYLPFEDANYKVLYAKVLRGKYETPEWISEDLSQLLSGILNVDPSKRFRIQQIQNHPWLKGISIENTVQTESRIRQMAYPLVQRALNVELADILDDISKANQSEIQLYLHLYMKQISKKYRSRSKTFLIDRTNNSSNNNNRKRITSQVHSKVLKVKQTPFKGLIHLNYIYEGNETQVKKQIVKQKLKENIEFNDSECTINNKNYCLQFVAKELFYLQTKKC